MCIRDRLSVDDTMPPLVVCKPATVSLTGGSVSITPADVFDSGTDNCGGAVTLVSVTPDTFNCPGTYTATLSASDGNGNTTACMATVTVTEGRPTPTVVYVDDGYTGLATCTPVDWPY